MLFRIFSFFIIVGCSACRPSVLESALERAGENRIELERVLRHYSEEDKDSLKWEAARFLIENMPGHLSIGGDSIGPYYAALNAVFSNDTLRNWQDSLDAGAACQGLCNLLTLAIRGYVALFVQFTYC